MTTLTCGGCGSPLRPGDVRCPWCHSHSRHVGVSEQVSATDSLKVMVRHGQPGAVRAHLELTVKPEYARDRGRWESVQRTFDHEAGTYVEEYRAEGTGELAFRKAVPLTDQSAHGRRRGN